MTKYAIFSYHSKQYKISEGDEVWLDGREAPDSKTLELENVLLLNDNGKVKIGTPFVSGAKVTCEILGEEKGPKIDVLKYKAKSRYRKHIGHRSLYTKVKVQKIVNSSKS